MTQRLKILWLKSGPLHPIDTGGKIRTFNMLRELKKLHEVHYLALSKQEWIDQDRGEAAEYSHAHFWIPWRETAKGTPAFYGDLLGNFLFSNLPYGVAKYESTAMKAKIAELDRSRKYDLIISDFLVPAINVFDGQDGLATKSLLFQHNVEAQIWERSYQTAGNPLQKFYLQKQWRRMADFEKTSAERFDGVVAVSEDDCRLMRERYGLKNVLGSVPTGVDTEYFQPDATPKKKHSLIFLGSMDWRPNIDGIDFFMNEVYPRIKQRVPDVSLSIVGRNPGASIKALAETDASITVSGTVPDVRPHLASSEIMVVPLRIGGGTRIKIYEAMSAGLPVVSTRVGAEGLDVRDGEHIVLADAPEEFARATADLLLNADRRRQIAAAGCEVVRKNFSWTGVTAIFAEYCTRICGTSGGTKN